MTTTPYQMAINNCAAELKRNEKRSMFERNTIDAFQMSEVLAIAFCTDKEKVISDIVAAVMKKCESVIHDGSENTP